MTDKKRQSKIAKNIMLAAIALLIMLPAGLNVQAETTTQAVAANEQAPGEPIEIAANQENKYVAYLAEHKDVPRPDQEILLEAADYSRVEGGGFEKWSDYEGMAGEALLTGETGKAEWTVQVKEAGFYNLSMLYYPVEGKSSAIERAFYIDGQLPFKEAAFLQFDRIWDNQSDQLIQDNQGNDLRPRQVERPVWSEKAFQDSDGYENEPFLFYFSAGTHTLTLESTREPVLIKQLEAVQAKCAVAVRRSEESVGLRRHSGRKRPAPDRSGRRRNGEILPDVVPAE